MSRPEVLHAPLERGLAGLLPEWDTQTVGVSHSSAASVSAVDATGGACSPRVSGGAESAGEGGAVEGQDSVGTLGARERLAALQSHPVTDGSAKGAQRTQTFAPVPEQLRSTRRRR